LPSDLYKRSMAYYEANEADGGELQHRVWDMTPWMLDVYEGKHDDMKYMEIIEWCHEKWGDQAWWPSGRHGAWQRGGATVFGWTWWGLNTEEKMLEFQAQWGGTDAEHDVEKNLTKQEKSTGNFRH